MIVEPIAVEDSGANPVRKSWQTPVVITSQVAEAELAAGTNSDGGTALQQS